MIFESTNATIVSYPAYSGGKFLSNCLSLSKNCCPQDPAAAEYLLKFPDDYDRRLELVLKTLPPRDQMLRWLSFEYGDLQIYGDAFVSWTLGIAAEPNDIVRKLCDSNMRFFITDHSMEPIGLSKVWKNATIIRLINTGKFQDLCLTKKKEKIPKDLSKINGNYTAEKYNLLRGPTWPSWEMFQSLGYDISKCDILDQDIIHKIGEFYQSHTIQNQAIIYDVDQNYFDKNKFLISMQNLYKNLGLTDFSFDLTDFFYEKYISLHL